MYGGMIFIVTDIVDIREDSDQLFRSDVFLE